MIFVSRWLRDRTLRSNRVNPRLSTVVPNAIDTERLSPPVAGDGGVGPTRSDRPTLLFAGRLLAMKGIETLLRAMARLDPSVRLLLAGPGDQGPWKALPYDLGLTGERCEFLGRGPHESIPNPYPPNAAGAF